jgi:hypothetical protein
MRHHTVMGVFASRDQALHARRALLDEGVDRERIVMSADLTEDGIGGEAPGQSYENQPGQRRGDSAMARYGEAVRSGACTVSVDIGSPKESAAVEAVLRREGAASITHPF